MLDGNTKRIVVIKDIPSNLIEEAILILKAEPETETDKQSKEGPLARIRKKQNDYLVKEAEYIINDFIKEMKLDSGAVKAAKPAVINVRKKYWTNTVINSVMVASIALLIFLVTRFI